MSKNKYKLVKGIVKAGISGGLFLLPILSNGQDNSSIQRGVNAGIYEKETLTHIVYSFGFNKDLKKAIKNSQEPYLYTTDPNSYIKFNGDSSAFELYYSKENFDKSGEGKTIALAIRDGDKIGPCDPKGLGSRYSPLPSFYWKPTKSSLEKKATEEVPEEKPQEKYSTVYNININTTNNTTNDITNNYFLTDTARKNAKKDNIKFRTLIEGTKSLNDNFGGISINPQIGVGPIWFGPYAKYNFGVKNNSFSEDVYKKTLLNQTIQLFTETEGKRIGSSKLKRPFEFGGVLSLDLTKDGRVRMDLSYGEINENFSTSDITESGMDRMLKGDVVLQEKPYNVKIKDGKRYKSWNQIQKAGIAVQPFKKVPAYFGAEIQHIGKPNSKQGATTYNVKVGGNLWSKK
jgi:hypothetical protein